jgi:hypothetical protein
MGLVPIKLLKNTLGRQRLLKIKDEDAEIDTNDYIESRINTNAKARDLLAIEDGSEMAKFFLHKKGRLEAIAKDIQKESGKSFKFFFRKTKVLERTRLSCISARSGVDYMLIEHSYPDGSGHYGMARIDHDKKVAKIFDSMTDNESDFQDPLEHFLGSTYTTTTASIFGCTGRIQNAVGHNLNPQPTGGFVSQSFNEFKSTNYAGGRGGVPKKLLEEAFVLSQYDEMSQHHFCYMESLHAMMADLGLAHPGPQDPRERLEYIKRFIWGVIWKYVPESEKRIRGTVRPEWKYFLETFPYILETSDSNGKRLPIRRGYIQVPPTRGKIQYKLKKMRVETVGKILRGPATPLKDIAKWAKGTRKWIGM